MFIFERRTSLEIKMSYYSAYADLREIAIAIIKEVGSMDLTEEEDVIELLYNGDSFRVEEVKFDKKANAVVCKGYFTDTEEEETINLDWFDGAYQDVLYCQIIDIEAKEK